MLVDCGLFQGERRWRRRNWEPLGVDPASAGLGMLTLARVMSLVVALREDSEATI